MFKILSNSISISHLVLAISTGMEKNVVTKPLIILATKCRNSPSEKYPTITNIIYIHKYVRIKDALCSS
jgi:hypothetical protein